jgi:hypothetical protein
MLRRIPRFYRDISLGRIERLGEVSVHMGSASGRKYGFSRGLNCNTRIYLLNRASPNQRSDFVLLPTLDRRRISDEVPEVIQATLRV